MNNRFTEESVLRFADQYLYPYQIKEKIDGIEIVPELCPICGGGDHGDRGTFALSVTRGCYVCKRGSCGATGRIEDLMRRMGADPSTLRTIGGKTVERTARYKLPNVNPCPATEEIYSYFESRKISRKTVDEFKIASDKNGNILFPFYENGVLTYIKYRKPKAPETDKDRRFKEWQEASAKPILFHMDECVFDQPLYITEGEIDAMSLAQAGLHNVVSVPCGCDNLLWIETCYDWLEKFNTIVLFGDNDAPGIKMVGEVSKRLDESRCLVVREYPTGHFGEKLKDANEILIACGPQEVADTANSAEELDTPGLMKLSEVEIVDETTIPRIKTMLPSLDAATGGLMPGGLVVFTGSAGNGKSSLASQILLSAVEQGKTVCAYSGELDASRFLSIANFQAAGSDYIGLKYDPVRGKEVPFIPYNVVQRIQQWYGDRFLLADNNALMGSDVCDGIINIFKTAVRRYGAELFLVDNLMTVTAASTAEELKAQQRAVNELKRFAIKYQVCIILVSHPRKSKSGETIKKDDVSGTAMIVNLADTVVVVGRGTIEIIKNRWTGQLKRFESVYCGDSRHIYEMNVGDKASFSWDKVGIEPPKVKANSKEEYNIYLPEIMQPF